jgi:beta-lactam-binding protein with PASTA domain
VKTLRVILTVTRRLLVVTALLVVFIASFLATLYYSRGQEVFVPKLVGKTESESRQLAQRIGLQVESVEVVDDNAPNNLIIRQDPKPGLLVKEGYTIKVYLKKVTRKFS